MDLPRAFLARMQTQLGADFDKYLDSIASPTAKALRVNPLKITPSHLSALVPFPLTPVPWCSDGFYYDDARPGKYAYHDAGLYYIQEPSAQAVAVVLDAQPGERVLDLCAAPGGKATAIAGQLAGRGILVANEPHPTRAKILSQNIERMGVSNAVVTSADPTALATRFCGFFDRILVDAPCSGEGMFRKDTDTQNEWSPDAVIACAARQWSILASAVTMLRPGGRLVYSTCTFSREENECIAERLTRETPLVSETITLAGFSEARDGLRIWPHRVRGEGHFIASFRRPGDAAVDTPHVEGSESFPSFDAFANESLTSVPCGAVTRLGDQLYIIPSGLPCLDGIRILRFGLHLGTLKKNRFEPSHALSHVAAARRQVKLAADSDELSRYLAGETLRAPCENGWCQVTVSGYPLGWGKVSEHVLKNHYPKGLRHK
ncbi:MAG: RsmF rRNA methyltransferase first C-terminal domain-containing protein [Clostridia bacterium]